MSRIVKGLLFIGLNCLIFAFATSQLWAQATANASIVGRVTDDSGAAVPNVVITVTGPALQVPQITAVSDADGNYKVVDLPAPAAYNLAFALQGFETYVQQGLNLSVGFTGRVDAVLKVGSVTQTVNVTSASPVIDTVSTAGQTTISEQEVQNIPRGANLQEMEPMVAGLNLQGKPDVGDSNFASRATTVTYGIPLETTLGVEGIDNTDDKFANSSIYLNYYAVQEAEFKTSGNNADVAYPGVDQVVVIKSGSNQFHGSVRGDYENPSWQSNNLNAALEGPPSHLKFTNPLRNVGYYDYAADIGGRIITDKLWFYFGFSRQYLDQESVGYVGGPGIIGPGACTPVTAWLASQCPTASPATIFANLPEYNWKMSYQMSPSVKVLGTWMWDEKDIPNDLGSTTISLPDSLYEKLPSWTWKGEVQVVRPRWLLDIYGGAGDAHPLYVPQPASEIAKYGFTKGSAFAGSPSEEDLYNQLYTGPNYEVYIHIYDRHQLTGDYSYLPAKPIWGGTHQFKFGSTETFESGDTKVPTEYPSGDYLLIFNSPNAQATTPSPYEITVFNYPVFPQNELHNQSVYAMDNWAIKHVSLNLGVRAERYRAFYPKQVTTANQFADVFPKTTIPDTTVLTWFDVVPRAGVAWDIKGNGKTVVKGSFGMFGDTMGFLYANLYNPESVQSRTYDWNGPCQATAPLAPVEWQCDVTPATLASLPSLPLVTQSGGISQLLNRNLKQDRTYEYVAKVERQLIPNLAFTAGYIRHSIYNNYNSTTNGGSIAPTETYTTVGVNTGIAVGHPYTSYNLPVTFSYTLNGQATPVTLYTYPKGSGTTGYELLNNPSGRPDIFNTFEVALTRIFSNKFSGSTSFWVTKDHRWINGLAGTGVGSPNDDPYPIDNTWNWEARADVFYNLPWKFNVSSLFRATSGTYGQLTGSFSGTGTNGEKLNQGGVTMRLGPFGQYQGPFIEVWNAKGARTFTFRDRFNIEGHIEYFNMLNSNAAVSTSYLTSTFGAVTGIVSPRVLRLGAVFSF
jgi:hypothetical protein